MRLSLFVFLHIIAILILLIVHPHARNGDNGWAIIKASDHKAVWKWCQPWCRGFGNNVEVIPVLTDGEYLAVHKELD